MKLVAKMRALVIIPLLVGQAFGQSNPTEPDTLSPFCQQAIKTLKFEASQEPKFKREIDSLDIRMFEASQNLDEQVAYIIGGDVDPTDLVIQNEHDATILYLKGKQKAIYQHRQYVAGTMRYIEKHTIKKLRHSCPAEIVSYYLGDIGP